MTVSQMKYASNGLLVDVSGYLPYLTFIFAIPAAKIALFCFIDKRQQSVHIFAEGKLKLQMCFNLIPSKSLSQ